MSKCVIQNMEAEVAAEKRVSAGLEQQKELNGEIMRLLESVSGTLDIRSTLAHVCVLIQVRATKEQQPTSFYEKSWKRSLMCKEG